MTKFIFTLVLLAAAWRFFSLSGKNEPGWERNQDSKGSRLYGEALSWEEAKTLFPVYVSAYLTDVDTGKRFQVQRRGGTYHADVQPLTAEDTRVLRGIYGDRWSWQRRAVVLEAGFRRIAASINGMPHGAGKIRGNDFPGHFCVHFLNSRTHASGKVDTAHQMMVWKAAGQPEKPFLQAGPEQAVWLVFTAFDQDDAGIASLGLDDSEASYWLVGQKMLGRLPRMAIDKLSLLEKEAGADCKVYRLQLSLYYPGESGKRTRSGEIAVARNGLAGRWLLKSDSLRAIVDQNLK
jgi:hypothetical protein